MMQALAPSFVSSAFKPVQRFQAHYTALHVEDEADCRDFLRDEFPEPGQKTRQGDTWTLLQASNLQQGLLMLRGETKPDVLVSDGNLTKSLNPDKQGLQMIKAANDLDIPAVLFTGGEESEYRGQGREKLDFHYIQKNYTQLKDWLFNKRWQTLS